jgi:selenocysteine lyase/cysteine desulfurase
MMKAFDQLEQRIFSALETYSNVHRGSGHFSLVTTRLYDQAREILLDYLGLNHRKYTVVFCSPLYAARLTEKLESGCYQMLSSADFGLSLGVRAVAVLKNKLPSGPPVEAGGGTARLTSRDWILWAKAPDRFEPGTPAIINVIAFAAALRMIQKNGKGIFNADPTENRSVEEILYHDALDSFSGQQLLHELRKTLIGRDILVPTREGLKPFINLDNSASTPTFMPVWDAFRHSFRQSPDVKQAIIREVSAICAGFFEAPLSGYDSYFTSNTTEAINMVSKSLHAQHDKDIEPVVLNTLLEHSSNDLPWRLIPGHTLMRLSVDDEGFINLKELESLLIAYNQTNAHGKKRIRLVAASGASNVLGSCNDLAEISRIVHLYGAQLLVDGAQLVAHRPVKMAEWGIDYLAFSAHKMYAPFGCGVLISKKGLLRLSSDEIDVSLAAAEENCGGIAALGKSILLLKRIGMEHLQQEEQELTARALNGMAGIPGLTVYGVQDPGSSTFSNKTSVIVFSLKKLMSDKIARELAERSGIGSRFGCHCAHIIVKHILHIPPALEKIQRLILIVFPKLSLPGVTRISFGIENTKEEVDIMLRVLASIADKSEVQAGNGSSPISPELVKKQIMEFGLQRALQVYNV